MPEAYIVDAVRTPVGKRGGSLAPIHPADLGAITLNALMDRTGIDPAAVEDVVMGCLDTIGPQAGDIARTAWLAAGLPETTPGVTVDRQCGSSQQAVHFAAQAVLAGVSDMVVAAGVQNMSMIPISSAMTVTEGMDVPEIFAGSEGWLKRYGDQEISQFRGADMIAEQWDITRDDMEAFAVESHERALRATAEGRFEREIVPVNGLAHDEGPREPNWEKIRSLLSHLVVPTIVIGLSGTAAMIRRMRANLLDELGKQYYVTAKAKGLPHYKALLKYPFRMSLNPFIADIGNLLPHLVSGSVLVSLVLPRRHGLSMGRAAGECRRNLWRRDHDQHGPRPSWSSPHHPKLANNSRPITDS